MLPRIFFVWLIVANLVAFALMGVDKSRAQREVWRISERTLFLFPLLGGSLGGILGMKFFRHKTLHWQFSLGFPLILIAQCFLGIWITCL